MSKFEPGFYRETDTEYYGGHLCPDEPLSQSTARVMLAQSPLHARHLLDAGSGRATNGMDFGTAVDVMLTGRPEDVIRVDAADWRTKAARDAREAASAAGRVALLTHDYVRALEVSRRVADAAQAHGLPIGDAERQMSAYWISDGVWCRGRFDLHWPDLGMVADLKCTSTEFSPRHAIDMGYHMQVAAYREAVYEITGQRPEWRWIVAEQQAPHDVYLVEPSQSFLELGDLCWRRAKALWRECREANRWPGRGLTLLDAPAWALQAAHFAELEKASDLPF